jgi:FkbH-like protein
MDLAQGVDVVANTFRMSDKFGDHGAVGILIARKLSRDLGFIDTLALSCRALGRRFETWMLRYAAQQLKSEGCSEVLGCYRRTDRNAMCADFFGAHGFEKIHGVALEEVTKNLSDQGIETEGEWYVLPLAAGVSIPVEDFVHV